MVINQIQYITFAEAVYIHIELMHMWGEIRYGVFDRSLVESALARPQQAAAYENANLLRQAATLCYGLIKNHPWIGGNKRTATALMDEFLYRNGVDVVVVPSEVVHMVLAVEADLWQVDEIEIWLQQHTTKIIPDQA